MNVWKTENNDAMGPTVTRNASAKTATPPLKNGSDLRESGYLIAVGSRTARHVSFRRKHKSKVALLTLIVLFILLLCLAIVMTVLYVKQKRHKTVKLCETKECLRSAANLALSMDRSAKPCEDFNQYVCGNWANDHPRPDAYRSYDWFRDKQTKVYTVVRDFLGRNTSHHPKPVQQAKDMYTACMDTDTLNKLGVKPVIKVLQSLGLPSYPTYINATEDFDYSTYTFDWLDLVIKIKSQLAMDVLIGFDIFTDPKNSSTYRLVMGSPETTNPFPSIYHERKRHSTHKNIRLSNDKKSTDETFYNLNEYYTKTETKDDDDDDDEKEKKSSHIYKLFYAEIIKVFYLESDTKDANTSEVELDQNIFSAVNDYMIFYNDIYELESTNSTESEDDLDINIPEYTVDELQQHTDTFLASLNETGQPIWKRYLEGIFKISNVVLDFDSDKILVSDLDLKYMATMAALVAKTQPAVLELYIWVKVVEVMAVHTTVEIRALFQRAYDEIRSHKSESSTPTRSLQCASAVNDLMGMAVSYAIADPRFLNGTKLKVQRMLHEMKNALAHLVGRTKWMDDDTKLATYEKIIKMKTLIGFPDWLLEDGGLDQYYSGIEINTDTHLENMISILQKKAIKVLNKYKDGNNYTWATDPTEVNAYHTFQENTITVPLVMLQYPFFDLGLDSLNYGSLGTIIGHEITHGFDNFGRRFDKNGNLLAWWSNDTVLSFVNLTQCFVDQYSKFFVPELGEHVDGKQTLGENIADNGGVREAFLALREHLRKFGPEAKLPGFEDMTSEQMFFLSYGNLWCGIATKESLKSDLEDEHSPQHFRAQGALQNNADFAKAFHCAAGSYMNPATKCTIF